MAQRQLYVDGELKFYSNANFSIAIEEDAFVDVTGMATGSYSYEEGEYLGWTTTQGGTTPDYVVGDYINVGGQVYLYSIPALQSTAKTIINGLNPIKKTIGTREIVKEVLNGVTVYEKQAPTPSGYNVDIQNNEPQESDAFYSIDGGGTWIDIGSQSGDIHLTGVTQIMFKADDPGVAAWGRIRSTQLGLDLSGENGPNTSQNYILTQDITDIRAWTYYD